MNDDELLAQLRQQQARVSMTVPVEQVIRRGRAMRARRRLSGLAVLGAALAAVAVLLPLSHSAGHQPGLRLAAWTVVRRPNGVVDVTIRQLRDAAGLQHDLRADGVPASVVFGSGPSAGSGACRSYGHGQLLQKVVTTPPAPPAHLPAHATALAIHPSALPSTVGVQIITNQTQVGIHLVVASQACTG